MHLQVKLKGLSLRHSKPELSQFSKLASFGILKQFLLNFTLLRKQLKNMVWKKKKSEIKSSQIDQGRKLLRYCIGGA